MRDRGEERETIGLMKLQRGARNLAIRLLTNSNCVIPSLLASCCSSHSMAGLLPLIKTLRVGVSPFPRVSPNYGYSTGHDITSPTRLTGSSF